MSRMCNRWIFLPFFLFATVASADVKVIEVKDQPAETLIPKELWKIIFGNELSSARNRAGALIFTPIGVELIEKSSGVLVSPHVLINMPMGGGDIDLAKYVTDQKGTFYVKFHFDVPKDPDSFHVLFMSQSRKRRVGDEVIGSGCLSVYDIKDYYLKNNEKEGIKLNTTRARHASVLSGNFIFSFMQSRTNYLSKVSFYDSRWKNLLCEGFRSE